MYNTYTNIHEHIWNFQITIVRILLEQSVINHVIRHFRHWSLATYVRARIIHKQDNPQTG